MSHFGSGNAIGAVPSVDAATCLANLSYIANEGWNDEPKIVQRWNTLVPGEISVAGLHVLNVGKVCICSTFAESRHAMAEKLNATAARFV